MQWSRVKSILIVLLVVVDGLLACVLGTKTFASYQQHQQIMTHLRAVMASYDVKLADDFQLPDAAMMPQLSIDRNRADEAAVAAALLGGSPKRSEGEQGSHFAGEQGEVIWSETGELRADFTPQDYARPDKAEVKTRAESLLRGAGLLDGSTDWEVTGWTAKATFQTAVFPVFNRSLTVKFARKTVQIEGLWTFHTPYATKTSVYSLYNPMDALLQFAQTGLASRVDSIQPGLVLMNAAGNQFQLSPVWRIQTDTGTYDIDPLKKEVV